MTKYSDFGFTDGIPKKSPNRQVDDAVLLFTAYSK